MKQGNSDVGGYGVQSKAGVVHDTGGAATAAAKKNGQPIGGSKHGGYTGVSGGTTGSGVGTSGLADEAHGAEAGSIMTQGGDAKNASVHAEKGAKKHSPSRSAQGEVHNAPGAGAE